MASMDDRALFVLLTSAMMIGSVMILILSLLYLRNRRQQQRHVERMAALEKGAALPLDPAPAPRAPWSPRVYLLRGLVWLFSGLALMMFLIGLANTPTTRQPSLFHIGFEADRLRALGVPEAEVKAFVEQQRAPVEERMLSKPIPFLGLVPIGVGLAYLIVYRSEQLNREQARREDRGKAANEV